MDISKFKWMLVDEKMNVITSKDVYKQYFDEQESHCGGVHIMTIDEVPKHTFALNREEGCN